MKEAQEMNIDYSSNINEEEFKEKFDKKVKQKYALEKQGDHIKRKES